MRPDASLYQENGEFTLLIEPSPDALVIGAMTRGRGSLCGTKEQFKDLRDMLNDMFDFEEDE